MINWFRRLYNKWFPHKCQYCGAMVSVDDKYCYANPYWRPEFFKTQPEENIPTHIKEPIASTVPKRVKEDVEEDFITHTLSKQNTVEKTKVMLDNLSKRTPKEEDFLRNQKAEATPLRNNIDFEEDFDTEKKRERKKK